MRVLVTGGAGYIGSETVRRLAARGHEPVVLDTLERGHRAALDGAPLVVGSIADERAGRVDDPRTRHRGGDPFRRPEVGRGLAAPTRPRYFATNVGGSFALAPGDGPERGSAARLLVVVRGLRHAVLPAGQGDERAPPGEPVRRDEAPRRARAGRWLAGAGFSAISLRYFNAAGAAFDGRHGEDWTDAPNLVPVVIKATLGRGPAGPGPRLRLSDARRHRDPRLRPRGRPRRRSPRRRRGPRRRPGRARSSTSAPGVGSSVREVIEAVARTADRTVPDDRGAETRRGPGGDLGGSRRSPRRSSAGGPSHGLDAIVETAWRWHSTHPDGYGPESAENEAVPAAERRSSALAASTDHAPAVADDPLPGGHPHVPPRRSGSATSCRGSRS